MTLAQLAQLIGREGLLRIDGLQVAVKILDIKQAYGNTRYQVTPVNGNGIITVDSARVTPIDDSGDYHGEWCDECGDYHDLENEFLTIKEQGA